MMMIVLVHAALLAVVVKIAGQLLKAGTELVTVAGRHTDST
jgi:hypothetical protein